MTLIRKITDSRIGTIALVAVLAVLIFPENVNAARLWSSGCELQGDNPLGVTSAIDAIDNLEWVTSWTRAGSTSGSASDETQISTTTKRSGLSSCRVFSSTTGSGFFVHDYSAVEVSSPIYFRFYFKVGTMSTENVDILKIKSSSQTVGSLVLLPDGKMGWEDNTEEEPPDFTTPTPIITTNNWYRVEVMYYGNHQIIVKVDGITVLDVPDIGAAGALEFALGMCIHFCGADGLTAADLYFDDIAVNDTIGTYQNSWPGSGSIVHMQPNAPGDGTVGCSIGDYNSVREVTPDGDTSYCNLDTDTGDVLEVNMESSASAGIGSTDPITLVQVGVRERPVTTSSTSWTLRLRSASLGTAPDGIPTIHTGDTSYSTNGDALPRNYTLTSYTDPTTLVAWTPTGPNSLDNLQVGINCTDCNPDTRVTTLWALVEYVSPLLPTFVEPTGNALVPGTNASRYLDTSATSQEKGASPSGAQGVGLGADFFTAIVSLCLGTGPGGCITKWWPALAQPTTCKLEVQRVRGGSTTFGSTFNTQRCDSRLSLPAKALGWVATGMDYCDVGSSGSPCSATTIAGCVYTRMVCTGAVTVNLPTATGPLAHPVLAAQTGDGFDFTFTPQCNDGINNDGQTGTDYPADPQCTSYGDNDEST